MLLKCRNCNNEYLAYPSEIKAGNAKYCSRKCFEIGRIESVDRVCLICTSKFQVYPSQIKSGGGKYCSKRCYFKHWGGKEKIICLTCKKELWASPSIAKTKKYCSHKCQPVWNANPIYRICPICKKQFKTTLSINTTYCSTQCYLVEHSKNTITIKCQGCNKNTQVQFHRQKERKYCSDKCKKINLYEKKRIKTQCANCKIELSVAPNRFKNRKNKFCSRKCMGEWRSENWIGAKTSNWKGGITKLYRRIRQSGKYKVWKTTIKKRDKKCLECGSTENLQADHYPKSFYEILIQYNITTGEEALACEELWNTNNGRTLCVSCHRKTENYGNKIYSRLNKNSIRNK